jgi:BirA family biotin operon repressor/biotin-[acetyl-CoA-carboxylase] ligase
MMQLDGEAVRNALGESTRSRLAVLEVFPEIESTNSYLMGRPGPAPGHIDAVVTDNQTHGRGRHGRTWQSPPGSGLCLSLAFTFAAQPANLPALTLAIGLGTIEALASLGVVGVQLKWPNDLVANDSKLGGILTETQPHKSGAITVVTGVGINVALGNEVDIDSEWSHRVADLSGIVDTMPPGNLMAARLIDALCTTFLKFEAHGFSGYAQEWSGHDWLYGRDVTIDTPQSEVSGVGAGIADDGALLVDTGSGSITRITSGSVVTTAGRGNAP